MSKPATALPNLLARATSGKVNTDSLNGDQAGQALLSWFPSTIVAKMRVDERRRKLAELFQDKARMQAALDTLDEPARQILAICKRHGGAVVGALLAAEGVARGLVEAKSNDPNVYDRRRKDDPISLLCRRMLLISWQGEAFTVPSTSYSSYRRYFPDVAIHPAVIDAVEPAPPLPWPTAPAAPPGSVQLRSTAEVAFDLWTVAQALNESNRWKTNSGGSLLKPLQNRLRKALASPADDPLIPPDLESLYYELLRGLDAVEISHSEGEIDQQVVQRHLNRPAVQQSWRLVQAWMNATLWQDGVGPISARPRYYDYDSGYTAPRTLVAAKELVVWALQRVAQGPNNWLELAAFVADFRMAAGTAISFSASAYSWRPKLKAAAAEETRSDGLQPWERTSWQASVGMWLANAIMGTLAHLGLVERGDVEKRPCFRLTPLGQAVFAAPAATPLPETSPKFLTVQPNHEIVAYLNNADAADVWPLARMAKRDSTASGLVQTFTLTRDSVYQALESGLTLEKMQHFLSEHSTTGLPANVAASLAEWGRKREALTLRSGVHFLITPSAPAVLLAKPALAGKKPSVTFDHLKESAVTWRVEEEGRVHVGKDADAVALARLSQFAEKKSETWRITAESARRAHAHGIRAEQILGWLEQHADEETPPLLETMIRNWTDGGGVFLGELLVLQVAQEQACAVLREHRRFQELSLAHVPPNLFIVRPEKRDELEKLLQEMGFATTSAWKLPAPKKSEPAGRKPGRPKRRRS